MKVRPDYEGSQKFRAGRAAFEAASVFEGSWAIVDDGPWSVALRFRTRNNRPVLAEVRVYPTEAGHSPGFWSNSVTAVPDGGLPAKLLKDLALGRLRNQALALMADPHDVTWGEDAYDYYEAVIAAGVSVDQGEEAPRPGRRPLSPEKLALTSYYYVESLRLGIGSIHREISKRLPKHSHQIPDWEGTPSETTIRSWIYKARERGFLREAPEPGGKGGSLTRRALAVLFRLGIKLELPTAKPTKENRQ
jgi:hypothetical protein